MTVPEKKRKGPGRPRSNESEESILSVTLDLLVERGYRGVTINSVSSKAKVSKSTIYRRWESKEELILAAFDRMPALEPPDTGNVEDDLVGIVKQFIGFVQNTSLSTVLPILIGECANNPSLMEALDPLVERRREPTKGILQRAVERGELSAELDLDTMADIVIGPILLRLFFVLGDVSDKAVRQIVRAALDGLKPR